MVYVRKYTGGGSESRPDVLAFAAGRTTSWKLYWEKRALRSERTGGGVSRAGGTGAARVRVYCSGPLISQMLKLKRSPAGAVSLIVTLVPLAATAVVVRCTQ